MLYVLKSLRQWLRNFMDSQPEILVFALLWLSLAIVALLVGIVTGFYRDSSSAQSILVELHGSLIELAAVGVLASWILSRRTRQDYRAITESLRARLLLCTNEIFQSLPISTSLGDSVLFRFGSNYVIAPSGLRECDSKLLSAEVLSTILRHPLAAGSSNEHSARERTEALLLHQENLRLQTARIARLIDSLAALPPSVSQPALLENAQEVEGHLEQVLAAVSSLLRTTPTNRYFDFWFWYAVTASQLTSRTLDMSRHLVSLSSEEVTPEQLGQRLQVLYRELT